MKYLWLVTFKFTQWNQRTYMICVLWWNTQMWIIKLKCHNRRNERNRAAMSLSEMSRSIEIDRLICHVLRSVFDYMQNLLNRLFMGQSQVWQCIYSALCPGCQNWVLFSECWLLTRKICNSLQLKSESCLGDDSFLFCSSFVLLSIMKLIIFVNLNNGYCEGVG